MTIEGSGGMASVVVGSVISLVGALVSAYFHTTIRRLEEKDEDRAESVKTLKIEMDGRMKALHDDHAAKIHALELERALYVSRVEHAEFQAEMRNHVTDVRRAVQDGVRDISDGLNKIVERVVRLEANSR